jgi:hypothetical protein
MCEFANSLITGKSLFIHQLSQLSMNQPLLLVTRPIFQVQRRRILFIKPTADSPPATSVDVIPKGDLHVNGRPRAIWPYLPTDLSQTKVV